MLTVIPIFLFDTDQIWNNADGLELIRKFLNTAASSTEIGHVFVFTNNKQVMDLSNRNGLKRILFNGRISKHHPIYLPMGSIESLTYLRESLNLFFDSAIILNFRNPLISTQMIKDAEKSFKDSNFPILLSVIKSVDHPCQLYQHYTVTFRFFHFIDIDICPLTYIEHLIKYFQIDHDDIPRSWSISEGSSPLLIEKVNSHPDRSFYILTKPFYFDWEFNGIHKMESSGLYILVSSGLYIPLSNHINDKLSLLDETSELYPNQLPYSFWVYDTNKTARILFKFQVSPKLYKDILPIKSNYMIYGALFDDHYSRIDTLICKHPDENHFSLIMNSNHISHEDCVIKVAPISTTGFFQRYNMDLNPLNPINDFLFFSNDDTSGILQTILRLTKESSFDHHEPFPPQEDLWKFVSGQLTNMITGIPILGRQDFPDVFEPEGSFIILEKDALDSLDKKITEGKSGGFILCHENSIQIHSQLDWFRYQAILKTNHSADDDEHRIRSTSSD